MPTHVLNEINGITLRLLLNDVAANGRRLLWNSIDQVSGLSRLMISRSGGGEGGTIISYGGKKLESTQMQANAHEN